MARLTDEMIAGRVGELGGLSSYTQRASRLNYWVRSTRIQCEVNLHCSRHLHSSQEMFWIVTNLITPRALFSPIFLPYNQTLFGPTGSSAIRVRRPRKPYLEVRTKHEVDRMTRCRDMAIRNFPRCDWNTRHRRPT